LILKKIEKNMMRRVEEEDEKIGVIVVVPHE